jgi:uncharacterized membrane protein YfcA
MGCIRILLSPLGLAFGAVAMMAVSLAGFAIALTALGTPACYRDDSWIASDAFAAILVGIHFVGAIVGGAVARRTSGSLAVALLLGFALVVSLVPHLDSPLDASKSQRFAGRPGTRASDAPFGELVKWTEQPGWMRYASAAVGVTGVLFGGSLGRPRSGAGPEGSEPSRRRRRGPHD